MTKLAVHGPFREGHLHDHLRPDPVHTQPRQADRAREWGSGNLEGVEPAAQVEEKRGIEARPDFSGKAKGIAFEVTDKKGTQSHATAARIGEAACDELL